MERAALTGGDVKGGFQPSSGVPRLALTRNEAARALSVSLTFFEEHVQPELRLVRRGRRQLVPVRELEKWLDRESARVIRR